MQYISVFRSSLCGAAFNPNYSYITRCTIKIFIGGGGATCPDFGQVRALAEPKRRPIRELSFFSSRRVWQKLDEKTIKLLIPFGRSRKIADSLLLFVKISCDPPPPPPPPPPPNVCWVKDDVMPWTRHAKVIALAIGVSRGAVRSPGQSLGGGPGGRAHGSSENPGLSNSKNGLKS